MINWSKLWQHTEETFNAGVTLLVNNAGLSADWKKCLDIMLYGTCHGTYLAIEKMSIAKVIFNTVCSSMITKSYVK